MGMKNKAKTVQYMQNIAAPSLNCECNLQNQEWLI